jgi:hypothetical protein
MDGFQRKLSPETEIDVVSDGQIIQPPTAIFG